MGVDYVAAITLLCSRIFVYQINANETMVLAGLAEHFIKCVIGEDGVVSFFSLTLLK